MRHNSGPVGPEGVSGRDWSWADTIEVGSDGAAARVLVCAWGMETGGRVRKDEIRCGGRQWRWREHLDH